MCRGQGLFEVRTTCSLMTHVDKTRREAARDVIVKAFTVTHDRAVSSTDCIRELLGWDEDGFHQDVPGVWLVSQSKPGEMIGAAILQRAPTTRRKIGGIMMEYIAIKPYCGGGTKAWEMVQQGVLVCRQEGFDSLYSAVDLTMTGEEWRRDALQAHERWGFKETDAADWNRCGFHKYSADSTIQYMKLAVN